MGKDDTTARGYEVRERAATLAVDLWYPPRPGQLTTETRVSVIQIGLVDVRAADDIRVSYDFDRDGWAIHQQPDWPVETTEEEGEPPWVEVAFIRAWGAPKPSNGKPPSTGDDPK